MAGDPYFWRRQLGKGEFVAYQASARGGVVKVRVTKERAILGGRAVIVAKGELVDQNPADCDPRHRLVT